MSKALAVLGGIEHDNKNYQKALAISEKAIHLNPWGKSLYLNKSLTLSALKKYQDAIDAADSALHIDDRYEEAKYIKADALDALADIDFNNKNYKAALEKYEQAIKLNPKERKLYINKAKALSKLGKHQDAADTVDSLMQVDPSYKAESIIGLGYIGKNYKAALGKYANTIKAQSLNALADIDYNNKNYEAALEKYKQAIQLNSEDKALQYGKATSLFYLKDYQASLDAVRALEIDATFQKAKVSGLAL